MTIWIETKDRLPTEADADEAGHVRVWVRDTWVWRGWNEVTAEDYPAWMPMPPYTPPQPAYRPFAGTDEFLPHADRWLRKIEHGTLLRVTAIMADGLYINFRHQAWAQVFADYVFADDGTPCGVAE